MNGLTRRGFLGTPAAFAPPSPAAPPPNILFLISDDHTAADLGCYGNTHIHTPHLDRLAARGARFANCFVTSPQCSPNRSALFTGATAHTTNTSRLHTPMPPWEKTFLDSLKERGYHTGAYRKIHQGEEFNRRFDFYRSNPAASFAEFFDQRPARQPFFLHIGFTDPHRPYRPNAFQPPHDRAKVRLPNFLPDTPEIREDLGLYADYIARMDAECGQLLDLLSARGLADHTIIFFTADNGMPFPGAKGTCYDPGLHVPLLVHWPGKPPGVVHPHLISHVDLPATWLDLAGAPALPKAQGRSFRGLLDGSGYQPREAVFSERNWHDNFDPIRSIRTTRHKLIFNAAPHFPYRPAWDLADSLTWKSYQALARQGKLSAVHNRLVQPARPMVEIYDLADDPDEFRNLAGRPEHAAIQVELQKKLAEWMEQTYDFLPPSAPGWPARL
ncbi:MAG: sulfatase [Acidobacteria bacterium]|nr:sulfatase [Acidobacteriota bacterium]